MRATPLVASKLAKLNTLEGGVPALMWPITLPNWCKPDQNRPKSTDGHRRLARGNFTNCNHRRFDFRSGIEMTNSDPDQPIDICTERLM